MKFVECEWLDAARTGTWNAEDTFVPCMKVITRGWLREDEPDHITLVGTVVLEDGTYGEAIAIPRGCITSLKELTVELGESLLHSVS
jgi:hypothetical protein